MSVVVLVFGLTYLGTFLWLWPTGVVTREEFQLMHTRFQLSPQWIAIVLIRLVHFVYAMAIFAVMTFLMMKLSLR